MLLNPSSLSPINTLDVDANKRIAEASPLMDIKIVKHLLSVLKSSEKESADDNKAITAIKKFKQAGILKIISH